MSKIRLITNGGQVFWCPGCKDVHSVNTGNIRWIYNNNPDRPTFNPSILVTTRWSQRDPDTQDDVCHSFVTDGRIQFLGDCTHALAGQTVDLPEWPYANGTYGGIADD